MDDEDLLKQRLNLELETLSLNQLNELGNRAIKLGLIAGHGFRGGHYEILRQGKVMTFPPQAAQSYLQQLIASLDQP